MTIREVLWIVAGTVFGGVAVLLLGIFGFFLFIGLIILMFCGVPLSVTKNGKRIGTIRWGRFYRD
jgi:hypothetical protein